MKNSWKIYTRDVKNIGTNWVVAVLIGGLILLPSLYAWFNIKASWDPYGQTDQVPVGVVNEDEGATIRDETIHVGDDLVETLKENDSFEWHFVSRDKAMDKVEYGDYYAVIVIPKDFSEKLSMVIDDPQKATVEYYVNQKINAIAPKITDKGASTIVEQISSNFVSTVNGVIFDVFNKLGIELQKDLPDIERFQDYIFTMEDKLPEIKKTLDSTYGDANKAQGIIDNAQKMIPKAKDATAKGLKTINETTAFLNKAETRLNDMAPKVQADLQKVQNVVHDVNAFLGDIQAANIDFSKGDELTNHVNERLDVAVKNIETIQSILNQLKTGNDSIEQNRQQINEQMESLKEQNLTEEQLQQWEKLSALMKQNGTVTESQEERINQAIADLETLKQQLQTARNNTDKLNDFIQSKKKEVDQVFNDLKELTTNTSNRIDAFVKTYNEEIEPTIRKQMANAKETLASAKEILTEIQKTIPEVEKILTNTGKNLAKGKGELKKVLGEYPYVNEKVNDIADKIRKLDKEADLNDIIDLLQNDPEAEKSFFEEPVTLNENKIFPIENYGTGMTPFYTVLAIWVGGLLLISLLSTDVPDPLNYSGREVYFGRMFTFATIALLQTLIVTIGDMLIVGVHVSSPILMVLFGLFISMVFILIIYSLVSVFGDVGKALAIILLVLQIAGSGGTYPAVLLPKFFQMIHPFLPFTYAVDLMREAVGGIVWERVTHDMLVLLLFAVIAVVLGTLLKEPMNKQTRKLKEKSHESGLFH